jgi:hypothetical protein
MKKATQKKLTWWNNKRFVEELDKPNANPESGEPKGFTLVQLAESIKKIREENPSKFSRK